MEDKFQPNKKKKAKINKSSFPKDLGDPQKNKVSNNKSAKLKLVKIDLDSDEDNLDSVAETGNHCNKVVPIENDETHFTEHKKENSQEAPLSNERRKRKLRHSEKNCNDNVNTSLKISKINLDDSISFEDSDKSNLNENSSKDDLNVPSVSSIKKFTRKKRLFDQGLQNSATDSDNDNISKSDLTPQVKKLKKEKPRMSKRKNVKLRETLNLGNNKESESTKADEDIDSKLNKQQSTDNNITSENIEKIIEDVVQESVLDDEALHALGNLNIIINWDLPTSHKLDTGSHNLSRIKPKIVKALRKEGLVWKNKVKYTDDECEIIMKNWEEFSSLYGFKDPKVFFQSNQYVKACKYPERLKFKQFLAKGLPDRPLYSVYHKFTELFGYSLKGRWNYKEDMILHSINQSKLKETFLRKHILICKALDRNWMSVYRRMKQMEKSKDLQDKIKPIDWTMGLMVDLLENILKETDSSSVEDLRNKNILPSAWKSVAAKMEIDDRRIRRYWFENFYPQLFATRPIYRNNFKRELIEWLYKLPFDKWTDLSWRKISKRFYDVGKVFAYVRFRRMVQSNVPREKWSDFRESINELYHNYLPILKSDTNSDYALGRVRYYPEEHILKEIEEPEETEENVGLKEKLVENDFDNQLTDLKHHKIKKHKIKKKSMLTGISQTQKKSCKQKHKNTEEGFNEELNQNTVAENYSNADRYSCNGETECVDLELDSKNKNIETSFENRSTSDSDSIESEIFHKDISKNITMEKNENLEEISTDKESILLQKQEMSLPKKLNNSKHKNLDGKKIPLYKEKGEIQFYKNSEETNTTKQQVMENIKVENDEFVDSETRVTLDHSFKTEDSKDSFSNAELNHNIECMLEETEQTKTKKKDQKSSKENQSEKADARIDTDQVEMSNKYKTKKKKMKSIFKDNGKPTLENAEDRYFDSTSKLQDKGTESISNTEFNSFIKTKYISATSTLTQSNKKKLRFIDEFNKFVGESPNEDATPTSSKHFTIRKML